MSSTLKMEREDSGPDAYLCDNCGRIWTFDQLHNISDLEQRVSPGGEMPAGECPDPDETCGGSLCYPVEDGELPEVSTDPNENWMNDGIQFPRLLAELASIGLTDEQYAQLTERTDLTKAQIDSVLERADSTWEWVKTKTGVKLASVEVGQRVYWTDPDGGLASGHGTVVKVNKRPDDPVDEDTIISLKMDDGGEAEVLIGELEAAR